MNKKSKQSKKNNFLKLKSNGYTSSERVEFYLSQINLAKIRSSFGDAKYSEIVVLSDHLVEGETILCIGCNNIYILIMMALMVGDFGRVIVVLSDNISINQMRSSIEISAKESLRRITFILSKERFDNLIYNAIFVCGAVSSIPPPLFDLIKPGGRLLIPIIGPLKTQQLFRFDKNIDNLSITETSIGSSAYPELNHYLRKALPTSIVAPGKTYGNINLLCSDCNEIVTPPSIFCDNGHIICFACRLSLKNCPKCAHIFTARDNTDLDNFLYHLSMPCSGKKFGCQFIGERFQLSEHEESCQYLKEMSCNLCNSKVKSFSLSNHIRIKHSNEIDANLTVTLRIELILSDWQIGEKYIMKKNKITNDLFEFKIGRTFDRLEISCCYFGSKEMTEYFKISINIQNDLNNLQIVKPPLSYLDGFGKFFEVSREFCNKYFAKNGNVTIICSVSSTLPIYDKIKVK